jgi:hypothetical protein
VTRVGKGEHGEERRQAPWAEGERPRESHIRRRSTQRGMQQTEGRGAEPETEGAATEEKEDTS